MKKMIGLAALLLVAALGADVISHVSHAGAPVEPLPWDYERNDNVPGFVDKDDNPYPNLYIESRQMTIVDTYAYAWAQPAIVYCAEQGYLDGMLNRKYFFDPHLCVDKLDLAILFGRIEGVDYAKYTDEVFSDVKFKNYDLSGPYDYSDWYSNLSPYYADWAEQAGILRKTGSGALDNDGMAITRESLAVIIDRYVERFTSLYDGVDLNQPLQFNDEDQIAGWARESVGRLSAAHLMNGDDSGCFNPKNILRRAEICQIIYNMSLRESDASD